MSIPVESCPQCGIRIKITRHFFSEVLQKKFCNSKCAALYWEKNK